jgi:replicative superfamily II helicase
MEKVSWTNRVINEAVLYRVKEEMNILYTIKRRKAKWIGHNLHRNCFLKHVSRRKQLLDDLKEKRRYWKWKEEALDCTLWRTHFGRGYGRVVRQTTE